MTWLRENKWKTFVAIAALLVLLIKATSSGRPKASTLETQKQAPEAKQEQELSKPPAEKVEASLLSESAPTPEPVEKPAPLSPSNPRQNTKADYDCSDFASQAEAQNFF